MKYAVSGSSGLVGSALCYKLEQKGIEVIRLVRDPVGPNSRAAYWSAKDNKIEAHKLEGLDALIHLAGENVAKRRWSVEQKRKIEGSRVEGTKYLVSCLAKLEKPPKVFICASAVGYYGDRAAELLDENSPPGGGFLAHVCELWEKASHAFEAEGMRVINARIGIVMSAKGGALRRMLTPFRLGLGGRLGSGQQYTSWISLIDLVDALCFLAREGNIEGAVNMVSPNPVTNRELTQTLARTLKRPAFFPVPAFVIRTLLGQMGEELLLSSARVVPNMLLNNGFKFKHESLQSCFEDIFK